MINYKFIIKNYLYIYGVGMFLLIFVMFFGKEYYGAKGWLSIFGVSLQPAELFKLCLIVLLSVFLAKKNRPFILDVMSFLFRSVFSRRYYWYCCELTWETH